MVKVEIVFDPLLAVYANRPLGSTATANGRAPLPMVLTAVKAPVAGLIVNDFNWLKEKAPTIRNLPRRSVLTARASPNPGCDPAAFALRSPVAGLTVKPMTPLLSEPT